ncbi:MAG: hypothetical protein K6T83_03270 [Alicyclobacillus sp.]|nr:hypothetical protein [Alicyclobacillus sp.]
MAMVFLVVNGQTNAIQSASYQQPYSPPAQDYFVATVDDSVAGVKDLLMNPSTHTYDEIMGTNPYVTAYYTGSNLVVKLVNPPSPAPTTVPVSVCGQVIEAALTDNQATIPITVQESVTYANIQAAVIAPGFTPIMVQLGGYQNPQPVNMYQDESGVYNVAPTDKAYMANYYTANAFNPAYAMVDVSTWLGILTDLVVSYLIPNMENASYTPLNITGDAGNALNDIKTNLVPNILTTLATANPAGGKTDTHWNSLKTHQAASKTAATKFLSEVEKIPWFQ